MGKIRVLVVDDSAFMRKIIPQILQEDDGIEVIDTAKDGQEAFKKTIELKPDVITLDVEMPKMNGLATLGYIMSERPTPVIMLSAYTPKGAEITLQALEYGAVDFVCKPSGEISIDIKKVKDELISKIKIAATTDASKLTFFAPETVEKKATEKEKEIKDFVLVIIATSTGGPRALSEFIPKIPRNLPAAYLVVQHMSQGFTKTLAERLNSQSLISIKEAEDGEIITAGRAYVAPGNYHMEIEKIDGNYIIALNQKPTRLGVRPSADMTLFSAAEKFEGKSIAVVLTGMGKDGSAGVERLKAKKALVLAQDKDSSVIYGMPRAVIERGLADEVSSIAGMKDALVSAMARITGGKL